MHGACAPAKAAYNTKLVAAQAWMRTRPALHCGGSQELFAIYVPGMPRQEWVPGGELFHHLDVEGAFDEPTAMFYAANVLLALDFLHNKGIVYRDLKPENLLLDTQVRNVWKIIKAIIDAA